MKSRKPPADLRRPSSPGQPRYLALDGLRGVAAVIVVVYHMVLATDLGDAFLGLLAGRPTGSGAATLLANTPLRYLVMGPEAVVVFFVLSGFVLVLPMLHGRSLNLWNYYPRRLLRLWLPSAASIVLSVVLILTTSQNPNDMHSEWGRTYSFPDLSASHVIASFFLITGPTNLNNPLWSLKWELLFSLLLPIAFLLVVRIRRLHVLWVIVCAVISGLGDACDVNAVRYGAMFLAGSVVAVRVVAREEQPSTTPRQAWAWVIGGVFLLGVPDMARVIQGADVNPLFSQLLQGCVVLGSAFLVFGLAAPSMIATLLSTRPFRFLGRISFSLYLVHMPVLLAATHFAPAYPRLAPAIGILVAFPVSWLFAKYVEEPSARFARRVGQSSAARMASDRSPAST